jgi:alpha-tubulin suppressor-like RCC1 family protein
VRASQLGLAIRIAKSVCCSVIVLAWSIAWVAPAYSVSAPPAGGDVFAFGSLASDRTCLGNALSASVPTLIDQTNVDGVSFVEVGAALGSLQGFARHSLLVASDGRLFSCGINNSYRTGQGTSLGGTEVATEFAPNALDTLPIDQIAVGGAFNLILSGGVAYYLGNASAGQGLGTTDTVTTPTPITSLNAGGFDIVQVSAGAASSFALREDGVLFSWGDRIDGMLGF